MILRFEKNIDSEVYLYLVSENLEELDIIEEQKLAESYGHHIIILYFDEGRANCRDSVYKCGIDAVCGLGSYCGRCFAYSSSGSCSFSQDFNMADLWEEYEKLTEEERN